MEIVAGSILILVLSLAGFELIRFTFFFKNYSNPTVKSWPRVSVVIAVRNEQVYLPRLLSSLEALDYPEESIEFLIINDQSVDQTAEILAKWAKGKSNRLITTSSPIRNGVDGLNGKAAALTTLCKKATGEFLFFTDADCEVNPQWVKEGVSCFKSTTGMVIGITKVKDSSHFGKFQELEWWHTLGQVKIAADLGIQTTGLGNNMIIRKTAYDQSGGFERTKGSLTEDLEISRLIHQQGFELIHQISPKLLTFTKAEPNLKMLLSQRKRWFSGVITLPNVWLILLNLQFLYLPALLLFSTCFPFWGVLIFLVKLSLHSAMIHILTAQTSQKVNWIYLLFFDFYSFLINALTILYYFWPSKIRWKSRDYS